MTKGNITTLDDFRERRKRDKDRMPGVLAKTDLLTLKVVAR